MRACEDPDIPGVITGTFTLFDIDLYALIDPGSKHSYICMEQMSDKLPSVELLAYDLRVTSPLGLMLESTACIRIVPYWYMIGNSRLI